MVADKEGRPRIGLGMDEGVPSLAMMDEKEKKIMAMGETRKDTALSS